MVVLVDDATGGGPWCAVHVPDEVAIARRVSGDQSVRLMPHELVEAVRRMCVSGEPERVVADRLGIAPRSVSRIRADHALPASRPKASSSRLGVAS